MPKCPKCQEEKRQNRAGTALAGSQRYECKYCGKKHTPEPKVRGYGPELGRKAVQLYVDGMNLRRIACHLGFHHRTVSLWVNGYAEGISEVPIPRHVKTAELDELFAFIGDKKTKSISSQR
jgi:insertion element IS1 protein InsB